MFRCQKSLFQRRACAFMLLLCFVLYKELLSASISKNENTTSAASLTTLPAVKNSGQSHISGKETSSTQTGDDEKKGTEISIKCLNRTTELNLSKTEAASVEKIVLNKNMNYYIQPEGRNVKENGVPRIFQNKTIHVHMEENHNNNYTVRSLKKYPSILPKINDDLSDIHNSATVSSFNIGNIRLPIKKLLNNNEKQIDLPENFQAVLAYINNKQKNAYIDSEIENNALNEEYDYYDYSDDDFAKDYTLSHKNDGSLKEISEELDNFNEIPEHANVRNDHNRVAYEDSIATDGLSQEEPHYSNKKEFSEDTVHENYNFEGIENEVLSEDYSASKTTLSPVQEKVKHPPKFMLELYHKYSKNSYAHPSADIVRSFTSVKEGVGNIIDDDIVYSTNRTRVHNLLFNITSITENENVKHAELRLYTLVEKDRYSYLGIDRTVSIYEVEIKDENDANKNYTLVSKRQIYGRNSGWETFKITSAVKKWITMKRSLQILEIWIETVHDGAKSEHGDLDIDVSPHNENEPLLVVFSDEIKKKKIGHMELKEMITMELRTKTDMETSEKELLRNLLKRHEQHELRKRSTDVSQDYKYEHFDVEDDDVTSYYYMSDEPAPMPEDMIIKKKRLRRKKQGRNSCRRKPMHVKFENLNWHEWIIAPHEYEAFQCVGKCYFPISDHLTPSKHAVVQTLLHTNYPRKAPKACCVPTKLEPISLLYIDEKGVVTYKFKYDGMVVAECGCR